MQLSQLRRRPLVYIHEFNPFCSADAPGTQSLVCVYWDSITSVHQLHYRWANLLQLKYPSLLVPPSFLLRSELHFKLSWLSYACKDFSQKGPTLFAMIAWICWHWSLQPSWLFPCGPGEWRKHMRPDSSAGRHQAAVFSSSKLLSFPLASCPEVLFHAQARSSLMLLPTIPDLYLFRKNARWSGQHWTAKWQRQEKVSSCSPTPGQQDRESDPSTYCCRVVTQK